jgi:hypothetical protein
MRDPDLARKRQVLEPIRRATAVLDRDPTEFRERLDAGGATELAAAGVLHAAEWGHWLITDAELS